MTVIGLLLVAVPLVAQTPAMMRKEIVVQAPVERVWHAWTTTDGAKFISAKSNIDLRIGGPFELFLDGPVASDGKRGSEGSRVLAFLPQEMLAFEWSFPPDLPTLRNAGARTQVVVLFERVDPQTTRVRLTVLGWQQGEDWERGYAYFDQAWTYVLDALKASLEKPASR